MSQNFTRDRFRLVDENSNTYVITNKTTKSFDEEGEIELDIVERSYNRGAVYPGIQRDASKELTLNIDINKGNDTDFRSEYNELLTWARKAVKIQDTLLRLETDIRLISRAYEFDEGGYLRGGKMQLTFSQKTPFWEDIAFSEETVSTGDLIIDNTGNISVYPVCIVETSEQVQKFLIKVVETNFGIGVNDLAFGQSGLNTYLIDGIEGEISLAGILRNQKIIQGTGFFELEPGENTIRITTDGPSVDLTVKWKRRFFI